MRCSALVLVLAACGPPPSGAPRDPAAWIASTANPTPDAAVPDALADDEPKPEGGPVPGCTPAESKARRAELDAITELVDKAVKGGEGVQEKAAASVLAQLREAMGKPCLAHLEPAVHIPEHSTFELVHDAWSDMAYVLAEATVSLHEWRGKPQLILPRDIAPELAAAAKADLLWLACPSKTDTSCDRVGAYIHRAELAFDLDLADAESFNRVTESDWGGSVRTVIPAKRCDGSHVTDEDNKPTSWEQWAHCVGSRAHLNRRFAQRKFRALDKGWLVFRGRRGHYQAADEIRAYDLATGAAYVVQHQTGVIMTPDQVALAQQGAQGFTGRIAPDQLREIAFLLLAKKAIVEVRTGTVYADIPPGIPHRLSGEKVAGSFGRSTWMSSAQTQIGFTYLDGATTKTGSFTWPNAADWLDDHVDELIRIMEAGMVKGCAPAKLPPAAQLAGPPAPGMAGKAQPMVSPIDASAKTLRDHYAKLDEALEKLRPDACRGVR